MEKLITVNNTVQGIERYKRYEIAGSIIYQDGGVIACFAEQLSNAVIFHIVKQQPHTLVLCKAALSNPKTKAAIENIFAKLSPQTVIEILD